MFVSVSAQSIISRSFAVVREKIEEHAPAEARLDATDGLEQGGLAAAVRTDECRDLPLGDRKAQVVDDDDTIVACLQMFYR